MVAQAGLEQTQDFISDNRKLTQVVIDGACLGPLLVHGATNTFLRCAKNSGFIASLISTARNQLKRGISSVVSSDSTANSLI